LNNKPNVALNKALKPSNLTIVSVLASAMTLYTLWSLHAESQDFLLSPRKLEWQQPSAISGRFPKLISTNYWQFDYEASAQILLKIKQSKTGELILNANTAKVLEQAVSELPLDMKKNELQRVEFLVIKGFPGKAGQQLSTIFTDFYRFHQASNIASALSISTQNKPNKELNFQQTILRQEHYLGKVITQKLFGRQNALTHYLYARRGINESSNLNQAQKQQLLTTLQDQFKANDQ